MLNRYRVSKLYRGFESRPLRLEVNQADGRCLETTEVAEKEQLAVSGSGRLAAQAEPASVPGGDNGSTGGERNSDKPDDKQDDKRTVADPALAKVIDAWPDLPEAVRKGILAMVEASTTQGANDRV